MMKQKKTVDIALPVYAGELHAITGSLERQIDYFETALTEYDWQIVLAINGRDAEQVIALASRLEKQDSRITYEYVNQIGKGSGVIHAWSRSDADIAAFMDLDLATDIKDFPNLVKQIEKGYDICVGSRFHPNSLVKRTWIRTFVSIVYHKLFMKLILRPRQYQDGQCGFKAVNRRVIEEILPLVRNRSWFFDSEMLYLAEQRGLKIKEIPITWIAAETSGLNLVTTIIEFIKCGVALRLRKTAPVAVEMSQPYYEVLEQ